MEPISIQKLFLVIAAIFGFAAVAAGAFGAHALKTRMEPDLLAIFEVGVRYQMYHTLALISVPLLMLLFTHNLVSLSGWFFIFGILIFSGSLYLLAFTGIRTWGAVTPFGGLLLLAGWLSFLIGILKS